MAEKHVHKVYGSYPPWGKSVEFPATGGGGNYVYYSGGVNVFGENGMFISILKVNVDSAITIITQGMISDTFSPDSMMGAGFDLSMKVSNPSTGEITTVGELIAEPSKAWTQITEEEFYKVAPDPWAGPTTNVTRDTGEVVTINYEEGMTWYEWCSSELNNTEFVCYDNDDEGTIHFGDGSTELLTNADFAGDYPIYQQDTIKSTDVISQDIRYATYWYD